MVGTLSGVSAIGTGVYPNFPSEGMLSTSGGGAPTFDPTSLTGCTVWLDASQLGLAADASLGSAWPNLGSGGAGTVVNSPAPVVKMNAPNGKPVVRFKANEGRIRGTGMCVDGSIDLSVFYVGRMWGTESTVGRIFSNNYPPYNFLVGCHTTGDMVMYDNGWVGGGVGWNTYQPFPTPWRTYGAVCTSTPSVLSTLYADGVERGSTATSNGHDSLWNLSGYEHPGAGETCDCEVAELICYDRALTPAERVQVETYLHQKWFEAPGAGSGPGILPRQFRTANFNGGGTSGGAEERAGPPPKPGLIVIAFPRFSSGGAPGSVGALDVGIAQIYTKQPALAGAGTISGIASGTGFKDMDATGSGELVAATGGERYFSYPTLAGDGSLAVASYKEIQTSALSLGGVGTLDADLLPTSQFIWRIDENVAASSQPRPATATAGVYVTLIGGGGAGRNGGSGAADHAKDGCGGGGGGSKVGRSFLPVSALGPTYSVTQGTGSTNGLAPAAGTASTFTSGGITLTAGGGQGGKGAGSTAPGGVASATGATVTLANGGVGAAATSGSGVGGTAATVTNGAAAGGGGGGGVTNTDVNRAGGGGGDTNLATVGNDGGLTPGGAGGTPTTVIAGQGGQGGGGGAGGQTTGTRAGGNGAAYGGGGGGGGAGSGAGNGGDGAIGYTRLEWVGQIYQSFPNGEGMLSATAFAVYGRTTALSGGGTLSASISWSLNFTPYNDLNVSRTNIAVEPGCSGCYVTLIGGGGSGGNGCTGSSGNLPGGGGGGGAAKIERVFIPKANLGATYSVARGLGVAGAAGQASTFSSGGVSLSAGGGGRGANGLAGGGGATAGVAGTGSASGVTATIRNGTAGGRGGGLASGDLAVAGVNNTVGGAAGGGGGGGVGSNGNSCAAAKGGNSQTVTGGNAGVTPPDAAAGLGGAGGGGNSGNGGLYGGGGGGGYGSTGDAGQIGGNGYSLIEWVS